MTDLLCNWLNKEVKLSIVLSPENFEKQFSSGFLLGEVLNKYDLQDDFDKFSQNKVSESKINNFTRIEPVLHLLGVPFDVNVAKSIMVEEPGVATKLMYQLYIALENKKKSGLTGAAMETMRPAAPMKLQTMESIMYKNRLKQITPRQTDLNIQELVSKFHQHQVKLEERALKLRIESAEAHKRDAKEHRQKQLDRSKQLQLMQSETMARIEAAIVQIPKQPQNRTAAAIEKRKQQKRNAEASAAISALDKFEDKLSRVLHTQESDSNDKETSPSVDEDLDYDYEEFAKSGDKHQVSQTVDMLDYIKPASNDAYITKIRKRLAEDSSARAAREKRRRKVLVDCLQAHELQEEQMREEVMANKMMRQSQMERRIAVQLLQARKEKENLKQNRMIREKQYQEAREKEFIEALNRERDLARQAKLEYFDQLKEEENIRQSIIAEKRLLKYQKHYEYCEQLTCDIVDFAYLVGQYRKFTDKKVPHALYRDWTALFTSGKPLITEYDGQYDENNQEDVTNEEKENVMDEAEIQEYCDMRNDWKPPEDSDIAEKSNTSNPVIGWIVDKLHKIVHPPTPPNEAPDFPPFPIKAAICGKLFSGKSSTLKKLIENNRCVTFDVKVLVEEAISAFEAGEMEPILKTSEQLQISDDKGTNSESMINTQVADSSEAQKSGNIESHHQDHSVMESSSAPPAPTMQPTKRAQLGEKISALVKKGKGITDQLYVDALAEAIHQVPEGTGWILDGFPSNYHQAKLLEKALTGYDEPKNIGKKTKRSLSTNPKPPPQKPDPQSGLDIVILFDIDDSWCVKRAIGRSEQKVAGETYHSQDKPPPDGSITGLPGVEKITPLQDESHDLDMVQNRLDYFMDSWPKVEKFYAKFGNIVKVDATLPEEALYLEAEKVLDNFISKKEQEAQQTALAETLKALAEEEAIKAKAVEEEAKKQKETELAAAQATEEPVVISRPASSSSKKGKRPSSKGSPGRKKSKERAGSKSSSRGSSADKKGSLKEDSKVLKKGTARKGSRSTSPKSPRGKRGRKTPEIEKKEEVAPVEEPAGPPPPKPGTDEWEYIDLPLSDELAIALHQLWDGIESGYLTTLKSAMRKIRIEKKDAIVYFYEVRKHFLEYLRRPNNKQAYLTTFQKEFNEIPNDLRDDEEMIIDLHQRVDELREALFDMTDKRKEQAEEKRNAIENCQFLEDRISILINLYIEIMQAEMDRFQDTMKFMKDYYKAMDEPMPEQYKAEFLRLPVLELNFDQDKPTLSREASRTSSRNQSPAKAASPVGKKSKKDTSDDPKEMTDEEIEAMFKTKVQQIPEKPTGSEFKEILSTQVKAPKGVATQKKEKKGERIDTPAAPNDADAKILFEAFWAGVTQIIQFVNQEQALMEAEEEADKQRLLEKEKEREKAAQAATKGEKGKGKGKKGAKSRTPSPKKGKGAPFVAEPAKTPDLSEEMSTETEEEKSKRLAKEKMRTEYLYSLEQEASGAKVRMQLVVVIASHIFQDLKTKNDTICKDLLDWIGARLLKENELVEELTEVARHAVESRSPIMQRLELSNTNFLLNLENEVVPEALPDMRPSPMEIVEVDQFKMSMIEILAARLKDVCPDGLMTISEFVHFFSELTQITQDVHAIPECWFAATPSAFQELGELISCDQEYVSWRAFLLAASQPWPWPSQQQLLNTLLKFKDLDQSDSGMVTREQYDFVDLWFAEDAILPKTPEDITQPKQISRLMEFKRVLFDIFSDVNSRVNYEELLFLCAASPNSYVGFLKALSVANGAHIPHIQIAGYEDQTAVDPNAEEVPPDCSDGLVHIDALYRVLGYGRHIAEEDAPITADLEDTEVTQERLTRPMLGSLYFQLGSEDLEPLPFTKLIKHVNLVELIMQAGQYKQINIRDCIPTDIRSSRAATAT